MKARKILITVAILASLLAYRYYSQRTMEFLIEEDQMCLQREWYESSQINSTADYGNSYQISFSDVQSTFKWIHIPKISGSPEILLIVLSRPDDFSRRNVIRHTWMSQENEIKYLFLIGLGANMDGKIKEVVMAEAKLFGDIVVTSMEDRYSKLSFKTLTLLLFGVSKVPSAQLIGKIDGDVLFFPNLFLSTIKNENSMINVTSASVYGKIAEAGVPIVSNCCKRFLKYNFRRNSLISFGCTRYAFYLAGPFYLVTRSAALRLLEASKHRNFHKIEDTLITGVLADDTDVSRVQLHRINLGQEKGTDLVFAWHSPLNDPEYKDLYYKTMSSQQFKEKLRLQEINVT
ncbi:Hexosyltransferase [Caenorhabditis elegans]|uniref:Hexosyltransferase n=1 Tax=Caenorhabditis elegans TaxID=6239 RepID=O62165_CAEEL|nr:Hexosyltransferase [Caenorhabditis elegans]CAB04109.3 Hexosyltransferase [Caenorhabditis elegans]|eukprot:NP_001021108.1 Hexosyltransferase [Caenorhabditis elegans]